MIPIRDHNPSRHFPVVTILLIAANIGVFGYTVASGLPAAALAWGAIPAELFRMANLPVSPGVHPAATLFTSMFLHGGLAHLLGNMLFLWVFGDNIEDRLGKLSFGAFYIAAGLVAAFSHAVTAPHSVIPMVGASGAISGVMGAYILYFPRARIDVLVFILFIPRIIELPAWLVLGMWAMFQFALSFQVGAEAAGVAYGAHAGGFVAGFLLAWILDRPGRRRAAPRALWMTLW